MYLLIADISRKGHPLCQLVFLLKSFAASRWLDLLVVHIGGGFVYLALHAAISEAEEHSPRFVFLFFLAGMILMGWIH